MNPPTKDAITKALDILLKSIQEENKGTFAFGCAHSLDAIPFEQLATKVDLLRLAKAHLNKEADDLISHIQHHRNLAAPIHRLPQEIFGMILEKFVADKKVEKEHGLLKLLHVGRLWYGAIINSPQLWTLLDSALPSKIAKLVIDRSMGLHILSLDWDTVDGLNGEEHEKILDLVMQNSTRFKSMNVQVSAHDPFQIRPLLEAPTSALEALKVEVYKDGGPGEDGFGELVLSEGAPLRHLFLGDVSLNFDSPRLSGLITLNLCRSAVPTSLNVLLQVLSATQRLEGLTLSEKGRIDEPVASDRQVTLNHLKTLTTEDIANKYCAAFLVSIYTPVCSHVDVSDSFWSDDTDTLDSLIWQPGNTQTAALLGFQPQLDVRVLRVSITAGSSQVYISAHTEKGDFPRLLAFERPRSGRMATLLGHFFSGVQFCPPIDLGITSGTLHSDAFDLKPWGPLLNRLTLSDPVASLRALEQLAQRTAATNVGEQGTSATQREDWMCPNLQEITLHIPEIESQFNMRVAALFSLVNSRWSGTDGGPAPAKQPAEFQVQVRCTYPTYKKLQDMEVEFKKVVPSFKFYRKR